MNRKNFIRKLTLGLTGLYFANTTYTFAKSNKTITYNKINKSLHPIIIIGSGYGAAVAALRLCQAGKKVLILEMGLNWEKAKIPFSKLTKPRESAAWLKSKTISPFFNVFKLTPFTGALDRLDFEHIKIWIGRGVGGGSLVNGGMAVLPTKDYFKEIFPFLDEDLFYSKYFPLAQEELQVNLPNETFLASCDYYKFNRVGEDQARKAGFKTVRIPNVYDFSYMEKEYKNEVPKSALAGEVIYGNNYGKKSLDKTYLKKALETGNLEILDLHHVTDIKQNEDKSFLLHTNVIHTDGQVIEKKEFIANKLILAAGTMGTLELLFHSNAKNNIHLDKDIGQKWGNNGNFMTGRNWVNAFSGGVGINHSTIPVGAIDNWSDPNHTFFTEIAPLPMGIDTATTLYLMINRVDIKGTVYYDSKKEKIALDWTKIHTSQMKKNAKYFIRQLNKANGGTRSHLLFNNGFGGDICYHPLGGVVLTRIPH